MSTSAKSKTLLSLVASVGTVWLLATAPASAMSAYAPFPSAGASYLSQTLGSGVLSSGGSTANMWTAGDFVQQAFSGTGLASVSALSDTFSIANSLATSETLGFLLNGTMVGALTVPSSGASGATQTYTFNSGPFTPIVGSGAYTLRIQLENTLGFGAGSLAFQAGGSALLKNNLPPNSLTVPFPAAGATYLSQTLGSGVLSPGGSTANMWTAGDFIRQSFSGTGLASVDAFSDTFSIANSLATSETLAFLVNGKTVGTLTVPSSGASGATSKLYFQFRPLHADRRERRLHARDRTRKYARLRRRVAGVSGRRIRPAGDTILAEPGSRRGPIRSSRAGAPRTPRKGAPNLTTSRRRSRFKRRAQ